MQNKTAMDDLWGWSGMIYEVDVEEPSGTGNTEYDSHLVKPFPILFVAITSRWRQEDPLRHEMWRDKKTYRWKHMEENKQGIIDNWGEEKINSKALEMKERGDRNV